MKIWGFWIIWGVCAICAFEVFPTILLADSPLNADKLITALRPVHPVDKDFWFIPGPFWKRAICPPF